MENFNNKIAVVTGGGTGMGRELVRQLAKEGCHVAMCDVIEDNMLETYGIVSEESPNITITKHVCDVSNEEQVNRFRDEVLSEHKTPLPFFFRRVDETTSSTNTCIIKK